MKIKILTNNKNVITINIINEKKYRGDCLRRTRPWIIAALSANHSLANDAFTHAPTYI